MTQPIKISDDKSQITYHVDNYPETCPICNYSIDPRLKYAIEIKKSYIEAIFQCPRADCQHLFIGYYKKNDRYTLIGIEPKRLNERVFSDEISSISKNFVTIYNQAFQAEEFGLKDIVGPGYRKSLEFLIKDYATRQKPSAAAEIKQKPLAKVISDYVADVKVKSTAKRATWLGNDETHYYRQWEDKDIKDLKILIELTVRWIESEELTRKYEEDMT